MTNIGIKMVRIKVKVNFLSLSNLLFSSFLSLSYFLFSSSFDLSSSFFLSEKSSKSLTNDISVLFK